MTLLSRGLDHLRNVVSDRCSAPRPTIALTQFRPVPGLLKVLETGLNRVSINSGLEPQLISLA